MLVCTPYDKFTPAIRDVTNYPCPVATLPTELLQEIFAFSMTKKPRPQIVTGIPHEEFRPIGFQKTALFLTWVCSQWRQIALSMPELWGTMTIYTPKKYSVELVKVYLSRSGDSAPLDLSLRQSHVGNHQTYHSPELFPEHESTVEILKLWVPQVRRWRKIDLHLEITPPLHELPDIPPNTLSAVEEANLHFWKTPGHSRDVIERLWGDIFRSPILRSAYWNDLDVLSPPPFPQLEEFTLSAATMNRVISVLPSCGRLKRLHIRSSVKPSEPSLASFDVAMVLPCLEYLALNVNKGILGILDHLTTPVLQELRIYESSKLPFADPHSLERFIQRSKCTLRTLHLEAGMSGHEAPLIATLLNSSRHLQSLETLLVGRHQLSEQVISLFEPQIVGGDTSVPFSSLLNLGTRGFHDPRDGIISSMVVSRSAAGAPLRTFECVVRCGPLNLSDYPNDQAVFHRLQAEGLQLCWVVSRPGWPTDVVFR